MPTVEDLRTDVAALTTLAGSDLRGLWRTLEEPRQAVEELERLLPALVDTYGAAAATVAADWYEDLREQTEVVGRFRAVVPPAGDQGADVLARWGVDPLFRDEPDWESARSLVSGGLQRRIANRSRATVTVSTLEDPQTEGWQRVATGDGCGFCQMIAARGAVYSRATVDFGAHDDCKCYATPAFRGKPVPVKPYTPTSRNITDADRARTRAWIADNLPDA